MGQHSYIRHFSWIANNLIHWCYTDKFKILISGISSVEMDRSLHSSDFEAIIQRYRLKHMISHKPFFIWFPLYWYYFGFCSSKILGEAESQNNHLKLPEYFYALPTKLINMQFSIILIYSIGYSLQPLQVWTLLKYIHKNMSPLYFYLHSRECSLVNDWQGPVDPHKNRPFQNSSDPMNDYNLL